MTSDRLVFLDVARDRYFCLPSASEAAFRRLTEGEKPSIEDRQRLDRLRSDGLLVEIEDETAPQTCGLPIRIRQSYLDAAAKASVPVFELTAAFVHLARAEARLKMRSLRYNLAWLERAKGARAPQSVHADQRLPVIAAAFQRVALIASPLNKCLPRSIAVASRCLEADLAPTVVIAVKLQPFAAHCWVQHGEALINERIDRAREFTPIHVI